MIDVLLNGTNADIAHARRSIIASRGKGDRGVVARVENFVARGQGKEIEFDATGAATITAGLRPFAAGRFSTPSIANLLEKARALAAPPTRSRLCVLSGRDPLTDIGALQGTAAAGTLFQVASQFNCLEAPNPEIVRVQSYFNDGTQGPRASISAFPGTLLRHYAAPGPDGERFVQSGKRQLNLLADALPSSIARVDSGYLTSSSIHDPAATWSALTEHFEDIRIGFHDELEVVLGYDWSGSVDKPERIAQVFTSTYADGGYSSDDGDAGITHAICGQLLRAAYLGTLLAAVVHGKRRVLLTLIGGGAFGNPHELIWESILWAADELEKLPGPGLEIVVNSRELTERALVVQAVQARGGKLVELSGDSVTVTQ